MIARLVRGIGAFGKLWTGSKPEEGAYNITIIERTCSECACNTRKFRANPILFSPAGLEAVNLPTVFITAGGVGSIFVDSNTSTELQVWNWSQRVGGHVIVDPLATLGGYYQETDLPPAKNGFIWFRTYRGSTLSEFVLVRVDQESHALPVVKLGGICPPCRHKQEVGAAHERFLGNVTDGIIAAEGRTETPGQKEVLEVAMGRIDAYLGATEEDREGTRQNLQIFVDDEDAFHEIVVSLRERLVQDLAHL